MLGQRIINKNRLKREQWEILGEFEQYDTVVEQVHSVLKFTSIMINGYFHRVTLPFLGLADDGADRVYMVRLGIYDSSKYTLADVLKVSFMITDILLQEDDNFVVSGQVGTVCESR